jgi:hypothetical protein
VAQREGDVWMGGREPLDRVARLLKLGPLALEEFEPRGRGEE